MHSVPLTAQPHNADTNWA